jgi:hypothetical protein
VGALFFRKLFFSRLERIAWMFVAKFVRPLVAVDQEHRCKCRHVPLRLIERLSASLECLFQPGAFCQDWLQRQRRALIDDDPSLVLVGVRLLNADAILRPIGGIGFSSNFSNTTAKSCRVPLQYFCSKRMAGTIVVFPIGRTRHA